MEQVIQINHKNGIAIHDTALHGTFRPAQTSGNISVVSCSTPHYVYTADSSSWMQIFGFHKVPLQDALLLPATDHVHRKPRLKSFFCQLMEFASYRWMQFVDTFMLGQIQAFFTRGIFTRVI